MKISLNGTGKKYYREWIFRKATLAFMYGGSLVRKDVPPYVKAAHEPLSYVGINSVGLRRREFSAEKIAEIQDIYRIIFVRRLSSSHAVEMVEKEIKPSETKDIILSFIRKSTRGLMKGYNQDEE